MVTAQATGAPLFWSSGVVGRGCVLRLIQKRVDSERPHRAGHALAASSGRAAAGYVLVGVAGIVAGMGLFSIFLSSDQSPQTALYKQSNALVRACQAAGAQISSLRRVTFFVDDCSAPIVTPIFGEQGRVIVRRTVEGEADDDDGARVTYSVKMDGRGLDKWQAIEVRLAPSRLTFDASLLPTTRSATPTSAQR